MEEPFMGGVLGTTRLYPYINVVAWFSFPSYSFSNSAKLHFLLVKKNWLYQCSKLQSRNVISKRCERKNSLLLTRLNNAWEPKRMP